MSRARHHDSSELDFNVFEGLRCGGDRWMGGVAWRNIGLVSVLLLVIYVLLLFVLEDWSFDVQDRRCSMACDDCLLEGVCYAVHAGDVACSRGVLVCCLVNDAMRDLWLGVPVCAALGVSARR